MWGKKREGFNETEGSCDHEERKGNNGWKLSGRKTCRGALLRGKMRTDVLDCMDATWSLEMRAKRGALDQMRMIHEK